MNSQERAKKIVEEFGDYGGHQFPEDAKKDQIEFVLRHIEAAKKEAIETFKAGVKPLMIKHATDVAGLIIENKKLKAERESGSSTFKEYWENRHTIHSPGIWGKKNEEMRHLSTWLHAICSRNKTP